MMAMGAGPEHVPVVTSRYSRPCHSGLSFMSTQPGPQRAKADGPSVPVAQTTDTPTRPALSPHSQRQHEASPHPEPLMKSLCEGWRFTRFPQTSLSAQTVHGWEASHGQHLSGGQGSSPECLTGSLPLSFRNFLRTHVVNRPWGQVRTPSLLKPCFPYNPPKSYEDREAI